LARLDAINPVADLLRDWEDDMNRILSAIVATGFGLAASAASAVTVNWADLTTLSGTTVTGAIGSVGVTAVAPGLSFAQVAGGTDYWVDLGYTQSVVNRPPGTDVIALNRAATNTITFSAPVKDVYLAFNSWNGNTVTFSAPFTIVSQGCGYWGCGTFVPNAGNTGFFGSGEVHGVLKFSGTYSSLSFNDSSENWHGYQIGIGTVPEPASWALLIAGFGMVGVAARRRRTVLAA